MGQSLSKNAFESIVYDKKVENGRDWAMEYFK